MKILFLNRSFDIGGAEQQLANLALGFHERGHDVSVAVFYGGGANEAGLHEAGARVCDLKKRGRWDLLGFGLRLVSLIRKSAPDVVYGFLPVPNLLAAVLRPLCRSPRIVWGIRSSAFDLKHYGWHPGIDGKKAHKVLLRYNYSKYYANTIIKISKLLKG